MHKTLIALCGLAVASAAIAQETRSAVADQTGTIRPDGPRGPTGGDRFFNIQGTASGMGTFDSYGVARWDLSAIRDEFDALFPGGWTVTALALELTQDNAAFHQRRVRRRLLQHRRHRRHQDRPERPVSSPSSTPPPATRSWPWAAPTPSWNTCSSRP
ncbi:MAG: hypothetical protein KatS3mg103_1264 [Phycisphaerales bacterium]|nr:MAG: hypothetical protein KatS3mg103_1264 [Phycisphaerales bacterium]